MERRPRTRDVRHEQDMLDEALKQSFPASDPPAALNPRGGITRSAWTEEPARDVRPPVAPPGRTRSS